jgi:aldehyde dehydrogenase (NAD+)
MYQNYLQSLIFILSLIQNFIQKITYPYTRMTSINEIYQAQGQFFATGATLPVASRKQALLKLREVILRKRTNIESALQLDLNKSKEEAYMTEIGMTLSAITYQLKKLKKNTSPRRVGMAITSFPSKGYVVPEPYGRVLIMSPWNYPFLLCMDPLVGAIAAGNCVMVKPANTSKHTSMVIAEIIAEAFQPQHVACVAGGHENCNTLLDLRFDYIFYTGSPRIGKVIMEKAAKHLTPVTLELGGKSPCIIDASANVDLAVKRLLFGKTLNAGQTCVAPDYLLVQSAVKQQVIEKFAYYSKKFWGKNALENAHFPRIINPNHFNRLVGYLGDGKIVAGGNYNADLLKIEPTLMEVDARSATIMQEEIFGPILPLITFEQTEEAVSYIKSHEKPLALYLFSTNKHVQRIFEREVPFGGGCINDTIMHLSEKNLPFGGVGNSGMGSYHGKASFDTFTHYKSVLYRGNWLDPAFRYQPIGKIKMWLVSKFLK